MHQMVATGREVELLVVHLQMPPLSFFLFTYVFQIGWGSAFSGFDCSGDMDISGEGTAYQCPRDLGSSVSLRYLPSQDLGRDLSVVEHFLESKGDGISRHV